MPDTQAEQGIRLLFEIFNGMLRCDAAIGAAKQQRTAAAVVAHRGHLCHGAGTGRIEAGDHITVDVDDLRIEVDPRAGLPVGTDHGHTHPIER